MDGYDVFIESLFGDSHMSPQQLCLRGDFIDNYYKWDEDGSVKE